MRDKSSVYTSKQLRMPNRWHFWKTNGTEKQKPKTHKGGDEENEWNEELASVDGNVSSENKKV